MMTGIYLIKTQDVNYIGSSINIERRIKTHLSRLNNNNHSNSILQQSFKGHIEWKCLEECSESDLLDREAYWHTKYKTCSQSPSFNQVEITDKIKNKFFYYIDKTESCWIWNGSYRPNGYGRFFIQGKYYSAHRIAYMIHNSNNNKIDKLIVMHKCDNKKCVNPNHLELGSNSQNHIDRVNKGIGCKLNFEYAKYIRNLVELNLSGQEIADIVLFELGIQITNYTVTEILSNRIYFDKNYEIKESYKLQGEKCPWSTISQNSVNELRSLYNTTNLSLQKLGEIINNKYGSNLGYKAIHKIVKNQRWKDPNYIPLTNKQRKLLGDK